MVALMTACPTCGADPCTNSDFCQSSRRADAERDAANARRCLYDVLGVSRDATPEQLKKAFIKLVKKWHPDHNPQDKEECTRRLIEINNAYEILKDPEQRAAYDKYGFSAHNLGATKQQREEGGGGNDFADMLAALFTKIADLLVKIARQESVLFHNPDHEPYAHAKVGGHRETYHVRSHAFALWLRQRYFQKYKASVSANAMTEALATITMFAVCEGPELLVHVRIAEHAGAIFIDLADKEWRAVKITGAAWEVVTDPLVRFVRSGSMRPLPMPSRGGSIEALRRFINVKPRDEKSGADEFVLLVAYALAALRPSSNYPVLTLAGEQGSGKTSLVRFLGSLIDPRSPQLRSMPGDERDLIVAARHAHFICFDNISGLPDSLSDAICRLSTGGGAGERRLYTNEEEATFEGKRPVCLNGIEDVATRPDLVDRALMLLLLAIAPDSRRDEKDIDREFAEAAPAIFGALLDGLVSGLRNLTSVKVAEMPRMADFALWAEACTLAYWPAGTFMQAYRENIATANEVVIEASPVGDAVRHLMATRTRWEGTASELLRVLTALVPEVLARERIWPKNARALSGKLRRAAPPLRKIGIHADFIREGHDRERLITIMRSKGVDNLASASSAKPRKPEKPNNGNGLGADANADASADVNEDADTNDECGRCADATEASPSSADNPQKNNGLSQTTDGADGADANSATSARSADSVPVVERCDHCDRPADDQPLRTVGDGGRQARLHRRCEVPWFDAGWRQ
jgi:hypothetical protein